MAVMILDPTDERAFRERHELQESSRWDEMWEGVLVVPPAPNTGHFRMVSMFNNAIYSVIHWDRGDQCAPGGNVSDRDSGWIDNYRNPDVVVYLSGNPAVDHGTHWTGGPDFLIEITSPGEDPYAKLEFYATVNTREVLIVHRDPWAVELFRLANGKLQATGKSTLPKAMMLTSTVLPLTFQLAPGKDRPTVEVRNPATGQVWAV